MLTPDGIPIAETRRVFRTCWQCRRRYVCHVQRGLGVPVRGLCGSCLVREMEAEAEDIARGIRIIRLCRSATEPARKAG